MMLPSDSMFLLLMILVFVPSKLSPLLSQGSDMGDVCGVRAEGTCDVSVVCGVGAGA